MDEGILRLPIEIQLELLRDHTAKDLIALCHTNRALNVICTADQYAPLWWSLIERDSEIPFPRVQLSKYTNRDQPYSSWVELYYTWVRAKLLLQQPEPIRDNPFDWLFGHWPDYYLVHQIIERSGFEYVNELTVYALQLHHTNLFSFVVIGYSRHQHAPVLLTYILHECLSAILRNQDDPFYYSALKFVLDRGANPHMQLPTKHSANSMEYVVRMRLVGAVAVMLPYYIRTAPNKDQLTKSMLYLMALAEDVDQRLVDLLANYGAPDVPPLSAQQEAAIEELAQQLMRS